MLTIYHNPRCSKSRQTLDLLQEKGFNPKVIEYLKTPLDYNQLVTLHEKLGGDAKAMLRTKEDEFKSLDIDLDDAKKVLEAIAKYPKLLERPIVENGDKAAIGRPPERVLEVL